jgi:hypothetical protein
LDEGFHHPAPVQDEESADLDELAPVETFPQVVDADSSQTLALLDVAQGRDLVLQGPPGTGKSQTITNLIAGALGRGQKVLFVAEKLAALEVVKRRLDETALGDACLELHSRKASKRAVLEELARTFALGRPRVGEVDDDLKLLAETRERLNTYCQAVNMPIGQSGVSPYQAFGELAGTSDASVGPTPIPLELTAATSWTPYERRRRLGLVGELQACLAGLGVPRDHPFWGARRALWLPTETSRLRGAIATAQRALDRLREAGAALARFMGLCEPGDRHDCALLCRAVRRLEKSALVQGIDLSKDEWLTRRGELETVLAAGSAWAALHAEHDASLLPEAWDEDLAEVRSTLNVQGRKWWRFTSPSYHRAKRRVDRLCRAAPPKTLDGRLALADAVVTARRQRDTIERHGSLAASLFAERWKGEHSSWEWLSKAASWAAKLHQDVVDRRLPAGLIECIARRPSSDGMEQLAAQLKSALDTHKDAFGQLAKLLEFDPDPDPDGVKRALESLLFASQGERLTLWSERLGELPALATFNHLVGRCRAEGLADVVDLVQVWPEAARLLVPTFGRRVSETILRKAYAERPAIAGFDGPGHEQVVDTFRELDQRALAHHGARLALAHWEQIPRREAGGQLGVLRREFEKKTRHLPVRQLLAKAGRAVQAVKPVFLMSPLSIAAYLEPGVLEFDLVVFDEASQVKPVDALGAILRGKQTVVVGDSRQLPPTQFFERLTSGEEHDENGDDAPTAELESILGLFVAQGAPVRTLRWHYRSRHESLIAVSNREFYEDRLIVFPSPDSARPGAGLVLHHLPDTVYDRGGTRTNAEEADAVARAVMEHARTQLARPAEERLTLGVAGFSMAQTEAIRDRLERLRGEEPACEAFFAPGGPEPFFVKNLENVQGDERDVILISIGYGRHAGGEVAMSFGPLTSEGGERRLNVLITRARVRCEVFTNLRADDLDMSRTHSRGVRALKSFLAFAETGRLETKGSEPADTSSPLEQRVLDALAKLGLGARPRRGPLGFAPDVAVADPSDPSGRELLALLGDGPAYQAARSARDRDRLRPQVLTALGWKVHRLWSAEWARNPDDALDRLLAALEDAAPALQGRSDPPDPGVVSEPSTIAIERDDPQAGETSAPAAVAYTLAGVNGELDFGRAAVTRVAARLIEVVEVEGPIHHEEATRRVAEGAGAKRVGTRMLAALERAREHAISKGSIRQQGDFLWPAAMERPAVRDRGALPASARRLELVAPEEIAVAIETVVADSLGIAAGAIPAATCRLLGFARTSDEMKSHVEAIVAGLVAKGRLVPRGEHLVNAEPEERPYAGSDQGEGGGGESGS